MTSNASCSDRHKGSEDERAVMPTKANESLPTAIWDDDEVFFDIGAFSETTNVRLIDAFATEEPLITSKGNC